MGGGGPPIWPTGGGSTPFPGQDGGPPSEVRMGWGGTPFPGQDGESRSGWGEGTPSQVRTVGEGGLTLPRPGWGDGGTPSQVRTGVPGVPLHQQDGVPPTLLSAGWVTPPPPHQQDGVPPLCRSQVRTGGTPNWNSMACSCYAAGGVPLTLVQLYLFPTV